MVNFLYKWSIVLSSGREVMANAFHTQLLIAMYSNKISKYIHIHARWHAVLIQYYRSAKKSVNNPPALIAMFGQFHKEFIVYSG